MGLWHGSSYRLQSSNNTCTGGGITVSWAVWNRVWEVADIQYFAKLQLHRFVPDGDNAYLVTLPNVYGVPTPWNPAI